MKALINWEDFSKIDLRVGTIIEVKNFDAARKPAWQLWIDFGEELGIKKSSAQIKNLYSEADLLGKQIIAVVNFPPKQIGPFMSECLVTGIVGDERGVVLLQTERKVANGLHVG